MIRQADKRPWSDKVRIRQSAEGDEVPALRRENISMFPTLISFDYLPYMDAFMLDAFEAGHIRISLVDPLTLKATYLSPFPLFN